MTGLARSRGLDAGRVDGGETDAEGCATAGISADEVCKSFGDHVVLDQVSLHVKVGTICALLGPNGAGKTTMVRILSTLIPADSGTMRVGGRDVRADPDGVRAVIGVTGQFSAVDNLLSGQENLRLMAELRHLPRPVGQHRVAELLERFELTEAASKLASTYSGGMRRRLDLAMTLVSEPEVIFLDEPTTGLDPRSRLVMWDAVRRLAGGGATILLTTQHLEEADHLADRVAVLDRGRIVAEGTPAELKARIGGGHVQLRFADIGQAASAASLISHAELDDDQLCLRVPADDSVEVLRQMLCDLHEAHIAVSEVSIHTPDLDDVFLAVTARQAAHQVTGTTSGSQASEPLGSKGTHRS